MCFVFHQFFVILLMVIHVVPSINGTYLESTNGDLVNSTKYIKGVKVIPVEGGYGNSKKHKKGVRVIPSTNNGNKEDDIAYAEYGEELPRTRCKL